MSSYTKEVILQPLTWDNINNLAATESSTEYFPLPNDEFETMHYMDVVDNQRWSKRGYWFLAYDAIEQTRVAGGGQLYFMDDGPVVEIGYWVTEGLRRSGYGSAILDELERMAVDELPCLERLELKIKRENIGSLALANTRGYEPLYTHSDGELVFWKVPG